MYNPSNPAQNKQILDNMFGKSKPTTKNRYPSLSLHLNRLSHESLQILCLENGLSVQGNRDDIIERLLAFAANPDRPYISNTSSESSVEEDIGGTSVCDFFSLNLCKLELLSWILTKKNNIFCGRIPRRPHQAPTMKTIRSKIWSTIPKTRQQRLATTTT